MTMSNVPVQYNAMLLKDVSFVNLMTRRIFNVLIVANPYDAFMLEDDGRVDEKIFDEYTELGLRYPPTFTQVSTTEEAQHVLQSTKVDLVICMPGTADNDAFAVAREVKAFDPAIPCVVLTPFSHGITRRMQDEDLSIFDSIFCWLGNTNLILSIIKLQEDKMNLDHDIAEAGVQVILLVEDSIRFYSSILPNLYNYILAQSKRFSTEALNPHAAAQRKRGRPKVVLARSYEEAWQLYERYHDNVQGVISDTRFPLRGGSTSSNPAEVRQQTADSDPEAGLKLLRAIRERDPFVPLILTSSETENRAKAQLEDFHFIDKNSTKMNVDLRHLLEEHFGFGDFIFRNPETKAEIMRIRSLKELQDNLYNIPDDAFTWHIRRNHMSRWLCARAIFPVSQFLKHITWDSLKDADAHRRIIFDAIVQYRKMKNIGVVAVFDRHKYDRFAHFARIGDGSLGGKGRGLAFLDTIIKRHPELNDHEGAQVAIPKTVVLCTDFFDEFMDKNDLWGIALSDAPDEQILQAFLRGQLPDSLIADFLTFFDAIQSPIAVRSSSLLEDSHYQPFAGIYATYMVPCLPDRRAMLHMLAAAIKSVYASVYYRDSKAYMTATQNVIDQEKMAVIMQEVVGCQHGDRYYPTFSGVLRSLNYYPVGDETAEEGIVSLALGLGKYIVDGGQTLRFSPYHPHHVMQMSEVRSALRDTQTRFYALDMASVGTDFKVDDGFNIVQLPVKRAEEDGELRYIGSTYDAMDQVVRPGVFGPGRKIVSFDGVLQQGVFPLAELLQKVQQLGADEMKRPVEVEFACELSTGTLNLLQIRPIVDAKQLLDEDIAALPADRCLLLSHNSLGHGIYEDVYDVVYVKADENFTAANNPQIAMEIEEINQKFLKIATTPTPLTPIHDPTTPTPDPSPREGGLYSSSAEKSNQSPLPWGGVGGGCCGCSNGYVLIGPGRWGSSDHWLGIPVKWPHISASRVIVETGLRHYHVDPSQGTHFFQNLTSMGVGYFTINAYTGDGIYMKEILDSMPAVEETQWVRHVRFSQPLRILMDGKRQLGAVMLPDS